MCSYNRVGFTVIVPGLDRYLPPRLYMGTGSFKAQGEVASGHFRVSLLEESC